MRVLYATDGSAQAREGEHLMVSMFDPSKVTIHALSVTPESVYIPDTQDPRNRYERLGGASLDSIRTAETTAERLATAGFTVSYEAARGAPASEILDVLSDRSFELVVLGASRSSWLGNLLLGSVSMPVLHHAPCSVLIAHHAPAGTGRVLIGTDGSAEAGEAARMATDLLDPDRSKLSVVMAVNEPLVSVAVYPPGPPLGSYPTYEKARKARTEQAWHIVKTTCADLRDTGFKTDGAVLSGSPGPQLLKEAENLQADLVVVGSRGLGPIKRAFLGSVSDQVARHAPATLVVRSPVETKD